MNEVATAIDADSSLSSIKTDVQKLLSRVSLQTPGEDHSIGLKFASLEAVEILKKLAMTYGANPITVARNGLGRNNLLYIALVLSQLAKAPEPMLNDDQHIAFRLVGMKNLKHTFIHTFRTTWLEMLRMFDGIMPTRFN